MLPGCPAQGLVVAKVDKGSVGITLEPCALLMCGLPAGGARGFHSGQHLRLSAAAAALDPGERADQPTGDRYHVAIDAMGRSSVQAAASPADRTRLVQDARRVAETSTPGVRGMLVCRVVRAFGDAVKFRGVSVPAEYSELAGMGEAALRYRDHCWRYDPPGRR